MNYLALAICALLAFVTTQVLIPILRRRTVEATAATAARTFHHTHKTPVSRFGGLALAAAFVVVSLVGFIWFPPDPAQTRTHIVIVVSSVAMFLLGFWDDLRPLGARKKLAGQVLIAMVVCYFGVQIEKFRIPLTLGFLNLHSGDVYELGAWGWLITVLWLVALTNMINLIDGIDGLAGRHCLDDDGPPDLCRFGTRVAVPHSRCGRDVRGVAGFSALQLSAGKNLHGRRGAYFLGFLIGILTLVHSQKGTIIAALIAPLFALALPIVDVVLAILRRGLKGLPLFRPDRRHIHHRLQELGMSRTRAVLILYGLSSVFLLMAFGVFWSQGKWVPILFGFMCLTLLLSARTFNFSRDWFAVGRVLENSAELRKETYYALALARWLELAAERCGALEELWEDFVFMARKLGFAGVRLTLEDGERRWQSTEHADEENLWRRTDELGGERVMTVEFTANKDAMSERLFTHLAELAAEAWLKAANRWQATNGLAVRFVARPMAVPAK